jgi:hypothetical protein
MARQAIDEPHSTENSEEPKKYSSHRSGPPMEEL